jgi:hypothetical protein
LADGQHSGGLVDAEYRQAEAVEVGRDVAWTAAEVGDRPCGVTPD